MITTDIQYFDLQQTADSGQCFRMNRISQRHYSVISRGRYLEIAQNGSTFTFDCPDEDFPFWHHYFDLETDYSRFISSIRKKDTYLQNAAVAGSGIRILNQDPWEMILTFILSQQKTIPKIKEAVEALSRSYGTEIATHGFYTFPEASQLGAASLEDLKDLKLGYRAKYIYRICSDCTTGDFNLEYLSTLTYGEAMAYLTQFYGIGIKVANCICLFGLHHIEAFPVDTWIIQILTEHYYKKSYDTLPKSRLYQTMIEDNFGKYKGYAGVMQQYIFYYERLCRDKNLLQDLKKNSQTLL